MRSFLRLNRPWQSASSHSNWTFSGNDEHALRGCLDELSGWLTEDVHDRWAAAIVFGPVEPRQRLYFPGRKLPLLPGGPERAWTIDGAIALSELLPDSLADVRDDLIASFVNHRAAPIRESS